MRKLKTDAFLSMLQVRELTVNAFTQQTGIPQGTLSHYVRGDQNIGPKTLKPADHGATGTRLSHGPWFGQGKSC